jgi:signal peptidase I
MTATMEPTDDPASPAYAPAAESPAPPAPVKKEKKEDSFGVFLLKLVAIVVIFRSFFFSPFNIPSESMLPRLQIGDYLLAAKWPYGYSKYSMPFSAPVIPGRIFPGQPARGDVVIFKAPPGNDVDYIKRVIGLPGDQVQMKGGVLWLNGKAVPKVRIEDYVIPISDNMLAASANDGRSPCVSVQFEFAAADGTPSCRYPQFRETLPEGKSYNVLDLGPRPQDDTPAVVVPDGHVFLMGDNRDNSMDSRFPAVEGGGIGIVPQANLVGRASVMMFSTDGSSNWLKPWTWFTAARWSRIGGTF